MTSAAVRLASFVFPAPPGTRAAFYHRLADALAASVARNSPATPLTLETVARDPGASAARDRERLGPADTGLKGLIDNTAKMVAWDAAIQAAGDGELVGLLDCDTLVVGDLSPIADLDFEVAYTVRPATSRFPFNSGVVFARIGPAVRDFFRRWRESNVAMLGDRHMHGPWRQRFGGINQAALGSMLVDDPGVRLLPLPCRVWNCEDTSWAAYAPGETRIVHVKGRLRRACLDLAPPAADIAPLVDLWKGYDRAVA